MKEEYVERRITNFPFENATLPFENVSRAILAKVLEASANSRKNKKDESADTKYISRLKVDGRQRLDFTQSIIELILHFF